MCVKFLTVFKQIAVYVVLFSGNTSVRKLYNKRSTILLYGMINLMLL